MWGTRGRVALYSSSRPTYPRCFFCCAQPGHIQKEAAAPQESGCLLPLPLAPGRVYWARPPFRGGSGLEGYRPEAILFASCHPYRRAQRTRSHPPWRFTLVHHHPRSRQPGRLADAPTRRARRHVIYAITFKLGQGPGEGGRCFAIQNRDPRPRAGQRRTNPWSPRELRRSCFVSARTWPTYRLRACPGLCTLLAYSAIQCSSPFSPESEGGAELVRGVGSDCRDGQLHGSLALGERSTERGSERERPCRGQAAVRVVWFSNTPRLEA